MVAIEAIDVEYYYRTGFLLNKKKVLQQIHLQVESGSVFGFLGPNGAGKTSLIHCMMGLKKPHAGSITIFGYPAWERKAKSLIGYLPERPYFYDFLTAQQFLMAYATLSGMSANAAHQAIPAVLDMVGLLHARYAFIQTFSKGMLQRLGIAQAIVHDPSLLILDEPMSGLDPVGRGEIRTLLQTLSAEGKTIFFSSHVIPDAEMLCTHIGIIAQGKMMMSGSLSDLLDKNFTQSEIIFHTPTIEHLSFYKALRPLKASDETLLYAVTAADEAHKMAWLQELIEKKAMIHQVHPLRPSLETTFLQQISGTS